MAEIVIADDGIVFDGRRATEAPIGGAESALVGLAEALAERGHAVLATATEAGEAALSTGAAAIAGMWADRRDTPEEESPDPPTPQEGR